MKFLFSFHARNIGLFDPLKTERYLKVNEASSWTSSERLMYIQLTLCVQGGRGVD